MNLGDEKGEKLSSVSCLRAPCQCLNLNSCRNCGQEAKGRATLAAAGRGGSFLLEHGREIISVGDCAGYMADSRDRGGSKVTASFACRVAM